MIEVVIAEADTQGSIVELAVAGDEVALARIVTAHHPPVRRRSAGDASRT
jgi:soluble P-type ATPase